MTELIHSDLTEGIQPTEPTQTPQTQESQEDARLLTASQIVDRLAVLLAGETPPDRKEVEGLKGLFFKRKHEATDPTEIELAVVQEERLNDLLKAFKELDRKRIEAEQALHEANRDRAEAILRELAELLEGQETEFRQVYDKFHELRQQWEATRPLSGQDEARLRKEFALLREKFYELKGINEELRAYDFRKNLEAKQAIIEALRPLAEASDVVSALKQMNKYAEQWHDLGPVERDLRQEIHGEYKQLSTTIYKRHQDYQDARHTAEQANQEAKLALVERAEQWLSEALPETRKAWDELINKAKALQGEWKQLGSAGKRENEKLYLRFREAMDKLFQQKGEFVARASGEQEANLQLKQALVAEAKALRESTEWQKTADALKALQDKWRKIGAVPQRHSQRIWTEFREHMDYFFERRKAEGGDKRSGERANLASKEALLKEIQAYHDGEQGDDLQARLKDFTTRWQAVGHVPFAEKERIGSAYKQLMDTLYDKLRQGRSQRRLDGYSSSIESLAGDKQALSAERQRMERIRERIKGELRAYDNNVSLFNFSSKGSEGILKDIEHKRQELLRELELLDGKIALLKDKQA